MYPLKTLIHINRAADQSVYLQIVNAFIHNIRRGRIRKGVKLPGSREMAEMLNVNRTTVRLAFDELEAQGCTDGFLYCSAPSHPARGSCDCS